MDFTLKRKIQVLPEIYYDVEKKIMLKLLF